MFHFQFIKAQNTIDETILEEIEIISKKKKKIKKHKISGKPAFNSFSKGESLVTRVQNLPEGKINSVTFYFNTSFIDLIDIVSGKKFDTNYKDVELGLLIYESDEFNKLGKLISDCEYKFVVANSHKGAYNLNLRNMILPKDNFFIGFKVLSETNKDEHNLYIRLFESENDLTYTEMWASDINNNQDRFLISDTNMFHIKMTFEIEK